MWTGLLCQWAGGHSRPHGARTARWRRQRGGPAAPAPPTPPLAGRPRPLCLAGQVTLPLCPNGTHQSRCTRSRGPHSPWAEATRPPLSFRMTGDRKARVQAPACACVCVCMRVRVHVCPSPGRATEKCCRSLVPATPRVPRGRGCGSRGPACRLQVRLGAHQGDEARRAPPPRRPARPSQRLCPGPRRMAPCAPRRRSRWTSRWTEHGAWGPARGPGSPPGKPPRGPRDPPLGPSVPVSHTQLRTEPRTRVCPRERPSPGAPEGGSCPGPERCRDRDEGVARGSGPGRRARRAGRKPGRPHGEARAPLARPGAPRACSQMFSLDGANGLQP